MKKSSKIIKRVLYSIAGIAVVFIAILVFHIATVKPAVYDAPNLQISRIDFKSKY